jgi:hypothetical protein
MIRLVVLLVPILVLAGCAGKGDVSGTVSYKGKVLTSGSVTFQGPDGNLHISEILDGQYSVTGVPTGTAKIGVTVLDESITEHFRKMSAFGRGQKGGDMPKGPPPKIPDLSTFYIVPQKFGDGNSSGLTFEVRSGPNTHDIDIKGD